jgi:hypothetical protein
MRAGEYTGSLLHRGGKAKGTRDKGYIVIDRLRHTHDGERVTAPARFVVKIASTALRAIAADGEEDVNATRDEIVHRATDVHGPTRRAEHCASPADEYSR